LKKTINSKKVSTVFPPERKKGHGCTIRLDVWGASIIPSIVQHSSWLYWQQLWKYGHRGLDEKRHL